MNYEEIFRRANDAEEASEYAVASRTYAELACHHLVDKEFRSDKTARLAAAQFLHAESCAVRAEEDQFAIFLQGLFAATIEYAQSAMEDDLCFAGLCEEWRGDSHLMLGSAAAFEYYELAADYYERMPERADFSWGMEEEFDNACRAIEYFLRDHGFDEELERFCFGEPFVERIELKRRLAKELLDGA